MTKPSRKPAPAASARPPEAAGPALAVWAMLAALVVARAATAAVPTMHAWSVNLHRFLSPFLAWSLWAVSLLALIPPVARLALPALTRAGDWIVRRPVASGFVTASAAAGLVAAFPDRVRSVGDFLLRQGTVETGEEPLALFPQALPLDVFLHSTLPRLVVFAGIADADGAVRWLGALGAAALALLSLAFARTLAWTGAAAATVAVVVFFGGYLGMFTGYSKAFAEMCLLVAWAGVSAIRVLREGRGHLGLGIAVALGLTLHRAAFGLVPVAALAWVLGGKRHAPRPSWRLGVAAAIPLAALLAMTPRIVVLVRTFDIEHFAPAGAGPLAASFAGPRALDLLNLVLLLSPAVPAAVAAWLALRTAPAVATRAPSPSALSTTTHRGVPWLPLLTLAIPFVGVIPFLHPAQGLFRDWDVFAASGVALSLLSAAALGAAIARTRRHAWVAVSLCIVVVCSSIQWLAHHRDLDLGLRRMRGFASESPRRTPPERGKIWDYVGVRTFRAGRYAEAAQAFEKATETSPSPRILHQWALALSLTRDHSRSRDVYRTLTARDPSNPLAWLGLATECANLREEDEARAAAHEVLRLEPGNPQALRILQDIGPVRAGP